MASTYEAIASQTLGTDSATVSFTSIPGTYTDLLLIGAIWLNFTSATNADIWIRCNSDSGSNYSRTQLRGDGSSATSVRASNATYVDMVNGYTTSSATTQTFQPVEIQLMSYANTNVFKTFLGAGGNTSSRVSRSVGLWRDTSAVTSVSVGTNATSIMAGSVLSLYGIKAA